MRIVVVGGGPAGTTIGAIVGTLDTALAVLRGAGFERVSVVAEQAEPEQRETKKVTAQQAPPRSATTDEWREFAESIDLDIDEDARRSDIIAAYEAAKAAN